MDLACTDESRHVLGFCSQSLNARSAKADYSVNVFVAIRANQRIRYGILKCLRSWYDKSGANTNRGRELQKYEDEKKG